MRLKRVLVVYKKSALHLYAKERRDRRFLRLLRDRHAVTTRFVYSHRAHENALETVRGILARRRIQARFVYRAHTFNDESFDLVLSVGGDGTFLEASHGVTKRPLLGLNSNPIDSVGMYCGARMDNFEEFLDQIEANRLSVVELARLSVRLSGKTLPDPVLNDILVTNSNPAATCRYILRSRGVEEEHKSSGIWISPPAGSTGAMMAAGGVHLPLRVRKFQYRVRELFRPPNRTFKLTGGTLTGREKLVIFSKLRAGRIFLDGPHVSHPFPIGARAEVSLAAPSLHVLGFNERRREQFCR